VSLLSQIEFNFCWVRLQRHPPKFLYVQVSNILKKPNSANRKTPKLNLYFVQKDFCDTCDSLGILLLIELEKYIYRVLKLVKELKY